MFRDFLVGTVGKLLQVLFFLGGLSFLLGGLFGGSGVSIGIGVVLLCMGFGVRYGLVNLY